MSIILAGSWTKIDPEKEKHLGHQYEKGGMRAHEKRCDYCGRWMTFDIKSVHLWGDNMKMGFNDWPEKIHCGSEHCQDYHNRVKKHEARQAFELEQKREKLVFSLQKKGLLV